MIAGADVEVVETLLTDSDPAVVVETGQKGMVRRTDGGWFLIDFEGAEQLQWVDPQQRHRLRVVANQPVRNAGAAIQGMQTFPASDLEGTNDRTSTHLLQCQRIMKPSLWSAPAPQWVIDGDVPIAGLAQDDEEHDWSGLSGDEVFYAMIKHDQAQKISHLVESREEILGIVASLQWATHEKARVSDEGSPMDGYFVKLQALKLCLGPRCELQRVPGDNGCNVAVEGEVDFRRSVRLNFHLPLFDVLPDANTVFKQGDVIYGGCREVSFRHITVDDRAMYARLEQSLDGRGRVARRVQVVCYVPTLAGNLKEDEITLHPGFELKGHVDDEDNPTQLTPGLAFYKRLVFEVKPRQMLVGNFPDVKFGDCSLDFDLFKVANLNRSYVLWQAPVNRASMRANILGIARKRQLNQAISEADRHYVYDVDWFPKATSQIEDGDIMFLPRLPPEQPAGVSQRFWKDVDIMEYAHEFPPLQEEQCFLCEERRNDCVLDPCGHGCCHECLAKHRTAQLTLSVPFRCWCRCPIQAVIRHAQQDF